MREGRSLEQVQDWGQFAPRVHDYLVGAYSGLDEKTMNYVKTFREDVEPEIVVYMIQHFLRSALETRDEQDLFSAAHLLSQLFWKIRVKTREKEAESRESERNCEIGPSGD